MEGSCAVSNGGCVCVYVCGYIHWIATEGVCVCVCEWIAVEGREVDITITICVQM